MEIVENSKRAMSTWERAQYFKELEENLQRKGIPGKALRERLIAEKTGFSPNYVHRLLRHFNPARVPCPACGHLIDKNDLPLIERKLSSKYTKERIIEHILPPKIEIREVWKSIEWREWAKMIINAFYGDPMLIVGPGIEKLTEEMIKRGFLTPLREEAGIENLGGLFRFQYLSLLEKEASS